MINAKLKGQLQLTDHLWQSPQISQDGRLLILIIRYQLKIYTLCEDNSYQEIPCNLCFERLPHCLLLEKRNCYFLQVTTHNLVKHYKKTRYYFNLYSLDINTKLLTIIYERSQMRNFENQLFYQKDDRVLKIVTFDESSKLKETIIRDVENFGFQDHNDEYLLEIEGNNEKQYYTIPELLIFQQNSSRRFAMRSLRLFIQDKRRNTFHPEEKYIAIMLIGYNNHIYYKQQIPYNIVKFAYNINHAIIIIGKIAQIRPKSKILRKLKRQNSCSNILSPQLVIQLNDQGQNYYASIITDITTAKEQKILNNKIILRNHRILVEKQDNKLSIYELEMIQ